MQYAIVVVVVDVVVVVGVVVVVALESSAHVEFEVPMQSVQFTIADVLPD